MPTLGETVLELADSGLRPPEIAHRLNIAISTVGYHLTRRTQTAARSAERDSAPRPGPPAIPTRELVAGLLARGHSQAEIGRRLGIAKSTVAYHARRLGREPDPRFAQRFEWPSIQAFYDAGHSVRECCRAFGFSSWTWHQAVRRGAVTPRPGFRPIEEIFVAGAPRIRGHLKGRLLSAGLKENRCELCGIDEWQGRPLAIALHHINGDRLDNRVENLQLLCPNCHSQTDNFAGRRRRTGAEHQDEPADTDAGPGPGPKGGSTP